MRKNSRQTSAGQPLTPEVFANENAPSGRIGVVTFLSQIFESLI